MRFENFMRNVAPAIAMAIGASLATGCKGGTISFNGSEGVPLGELDTSGPAPDEITLLGPDRVEITQGNAFTVSIDGSDDDRESLRFALDDGALGILRKSEWMGSSSNIATIRVTLPAPPRSLTIAGSGSMTSDALAGSAEVSIAGSGSLETPNVAADDLDVTIAGSGSYKAAGRAGKLELSIAGSGDADMAGLRVEGAEVSIAGSGDATFTSDGEVEASIMGSGDVTVRGRARCKVSSMGSGTVTCESVDEDA